MAGSNSGPAAFRLRATQWVLWVWITQRVAGACSQAAA